MALANVFALCKSSLLRLNVLKSILKDLVDDRPTMVEEMAWLPRQLLQQFGKFIGRKPKTNNETFVSLIVSSPGELQLEQTHPWLNHIVPLIRLFFIRYFLLHTFNYLALVTHFCVGKPSFHYFGPRRPFDAEMISKSNANYRRKDPGNKSTYSNPFKIVGALLWLRAFTGHKTDKTLHRKISFSTWYCRILNRWSDIEAIVFI